MEVLEEQSADRLPELVPLRYRRMFASPFAFFRGAASIMAADLAGLPRTGLHAQLCGDAHLTNFGVFRALDRRLVFSINDFDETLPGPFERDVKRLVTSVSVAARENGFDRAGGLSAVRETLRAYRLAMGQFASMRDVDVWYSRLDVDAITRRLKGAARGVELERLQRLMVASAKRDSLYALAKLCRVVGGDLRITARPPSITPIEDVLADAEKAHLEGVIRSMISSDRSTLPGDRRRLLERYRYVHAARMVPGVGSVGTRVWIVLLMGRDDGDPLFLQFKEAQASVLEPFLGRSAVAKHGERVVDGQRLVQATPDVLLGWERITTFDGQIKDFYVRLLWDAKGSADVRKLAPAGMATYGALCGWTLARAHARSGDPVAIASYLGPGDAFDRALAQFAESYADQNERDFETFQQAARTGLIDVAKDD